MVEEPDTQVEGRRSSWAAFFAGLAERIGDEIGTSAWFSLDQLSVDAYAAVVGDLDPMHNDPDWEFARREWGGTIAIGTHTLSMLPSILEDYGFPVAPGSGVEFRPLGLSKVRFTSPLPVGQRARDHATLAAVAVEGPERWIVTTRHTITQERASRPTLVAELISSFSQDTA